MTELDVEETIILAEEKGFYCTVGKTQFGWEGRLWRDLPKEKQRTNKFREHYIEVGKCLKEVLTKLYGRIHE